MASIPWHLGSSASPSLTPPTFSHKGASEKLRFSSSCQQATDIQSHLYIFAKAVSSVPQHLYPNFTLI